jgi:hypothetical protein
MSSIIVKGMQIPENCIKCPLQFGGWCYVSPPEIDERVAPTVDEAVEQGKPEWCPLVDLGKHGDLIDRDALEQEMMNGIKAGNLEEGYEMYANINTVDDCVECVRWADAVIEAEDGE